MMVNSSHSDISQCVAGSFLIASSKYSMPFSNPSFVRLRRVFAAQKVKQIGFAVLGVTFGQLLLILAGEPQPQASRKSPARSLSCNDKDV